MFHSRDSPRLLVCDTGLYLEQNDTCFITVAICGGYISKYPRLIGSDNGLSPTRHDQNQCWVIVNWTLWNKLQWNFNQNTKLFINENASKNIVCEMADILSKGRWVKLIHTGVIHDMTWASYQILKIAGCACAGNAGNVFPRRRFQRKPLVSDPDKHHSTCVTLIYSTQPA